MFQPKTQDGLRIWNQSEIINVLDTVEHTVEKLLSYLPPTQESDAYRHGLEDGLDSVAGMFGLRRDEEKDTWPQALTTS